MSFGAYLQSMGVGLEEHGWLKSSCMAEKPIATWVVIHEGCALEAPSTICHHLSYLESVLPHICHCLV